MIVWAGWGIIGAGPIGMAIVFGAVLANATGWGQMLSIGLLLIPAGVANYFIGRFLNVTKPASDLAKRMDLRSAQLHAMADAGTFYRGAGYAPPVSLADAHQQADQLAAEEYQTLKGRAGNGHTLFFIPVQWIGVVSIFGGIGLVIGSLLS